MASASNSDLVVGKKRLQLTGRSHHEDSIKRSRHTAEDVEIPIAEVVPDTRTKGQTAHRAAKAARQTKSDKGTYYYIMATLCKRSLAPFLHSWLFLVRSSTAGKIAGTHRKHKRSMRQSVAATPSTVPEMVEPSAIGFLADRIAFHPQALLCPHTYRDTNIPPTISAANSRTGSPSEAL